MAANNNDNNCKQQLQTATTTTATMASDMKGKLSAHYFPYYLYIGRAIVCSPSNLLFMAFFSPSRYESKLWDIRYALNRDAKASDVSVATTTAAATSSKLSGQLEDLQDRYYDNLSTPFEGALENLLTKDKDGVFKCDAPHKYQYYFRQSVDWELINVQPMRYMWNTTETIALYALLFTVAGSAKSYMLLTQKDFDAASNSRLSKFVGSWDTSFLLKRLWGAFQQTKSLLGNKLPWHPVRWYPLVIVNMMNFVRLSSTYKLPSKKDSSESESFRAAVAASAVDA